MKYTHKKTKLHTIIILPIIALSCFLAGCQPTPEKEIIVSKKNDVLSNITDDSSETKNIENIVIDYSAPLKMPLAETDAQ